MCVCVLREISDQVQGRTTCHDELRSRGVSLERWPGGRLGPKIEIRNSCVEKSGTDDVSAKHHT